MNNKGRQSGCICLGARIAKLEAALREIAELSSDRQDPQDMGELMSLDEAHAILAWRGEDGEYKPLVDRLRAHARLWRGATGGMVEHAWYCDEAADEIERLRAEVLKFRNKGAALVRLVNDPAAQ